MSNVRVKTPTDTSIEVMRNFAVPLAHVWRAMTEPRLVKEWLLGPPGWSMPVCESDFHVGGSYEYLWRSADGEQEFGFVGDFREIEPQSKIVHTERSPTAIEAGESLITISFAETDSGATVVTSIEYPSTEARDAVLGAGIAEGMGMSYLKLDELLAEL